MARFVVLILALSCASAMAGRRKHRVPAPARVEDPIAKPLLLKALAVHGEAARLIGPDRAEAKSGVVGNEPVTLLWPTRETRLSSGFGYRMNPITEHEQLHNGVDVPAPCGSEVVAVEDGEVVFSAWTGSAGNVIKISHDGGWATHYLHLAQRTVAVGAHVVAGSRIGLSGDTGSMTTGPHLHFEVWKDDVVWDPLSFNYRHLPLTAPPTRFAWCGEGSGAHGSKEPVERAEPDPSLSIDAMYDSLVGR
jgi:murein DD-endopeptidase MepM/ murein hydrolase activator NlpD